MQWQVEEDRKGLEILQAQLREEDQKRKLLEEDVAEKDIKIMQLNMVKSCCCSEKKNFF